MMEPEDVTDRLDILPSPWPMTEHVKHILRYRMGRMDEVLDGFIRDHLEARLIVPFNPADWFDMWTVMEARAFLSGYAKDPGEYSRLLHRPRWRR